MEYRLITLFPDLAYVGLLDKIENKAKQMLCDTPFSVASIAEECGFLNAKYFGIVFPKDGGAAPVPTPPQEAENKPSLNLDFDELF